MGRSGYIQDSVLCTLFKVSYAFDFKLQSFQKGAQEDGFMESVSKSWQAVTQKVRTQQALVLAQKAFREL